jgi:cold shock CspA family protein
VSLPKALIDDIREGNVVLFLGAGASIGAEHPKNKPIPTGKQLAKLLVDKYLGSEYSYISLAKAAELSIAQTDLFIVQDYIASILYDYGPAGFHSLIPTFVWKAIVTTNYDLVIDRAYEKAKTRLQHLVPFIKNTDPVELKLKNPDTIFYIKLHGCITVTRDKEIPLILTTEQYLSHRKHRNFLFERFNHLATQCPVIYIGSNMDDADIRAILQELRDTGIVVPRSYIVLPGLKQAEKTFWESYPSLSCIDMTFEGFLKIIDSAILKPFRSVTKLKESYEHPICKRFARADITVPDSVKLLISRDVEYINKDYKPTDLTPEQFYKGYYKDFSPIIYNYDIRRTVTDNIISEIFLTEEVERENKEELYIIRGHAGSGKTILLRRIAWDAATIFDKHCLQLNSSQFPEYEALLELYRLCEERIFILADPVHKYQDLIELWLKKSRRDNFPLTIVGAERNHEWNVSCTELYPYVTEIYDLKYLKEREIEELIKKLTEHKALGYLAGLSFEKQKEQFIQLAGRQLLVALYEATLGKPFEEIVLDEFKSISTAQAQSLYLTICILHRLGIPTRAGLISRVHKIPFEVFKEQFFKPLDFIVFAYEDKFIRDVVYRSRHPVVAEMVFEQVLIDEQDRFDEYMRILNAVDTGYSSDKEAFIKLMNARELMRLFKDPQFIRSLHKSAGNRIGEDPLLLQQEAIFEMNSPDGSIDKSGELLRKASVIQPSNKLIKHSLSEWALKKADKTTNALEKNIYRRESQKIARELTAGEDISAYPHHTLIKIGLEELAEILETGDKATIERKITEIERAIAKAKQAFPDDSYILYEESSFCELVNRHPEGMATLEKAFSANKGSPYIAVRLAKLYEKDNDPEKAIEVLSECIDQKPSDRYSNYNLAMFLLKYHPEKRADIKLHLRRSFTDGDINYAAQFWYARFLYLEDPHGEAKRFFKALNATRLDPVVKDKLRGGITENGKPVIFHGVVAKKELSYGFIKRDGYQDIIFMHRNDTDESIWDELQSGTRVNFEMAFSYRGPKALNVKKETI